jgi:hypothetical protein
MWARCNYRPTVRIPDPLARLGPMPTLRNPPARLRSLTPASAEAVARVHLAAREAYYAVQPDTSGPPARAGAYTRMWQSRLGQEDWQLTGAYSGQDLVGFAAIQLPPASHPLHPGAVYPVGRRHRFAAPRRRAR